MNGLKSLARELPKYGRYGDDIVAHISSDEARLLKSLGGSGTINPHTGLPEFFSFSSFNPVRIINNAVNSIPVVKDIYNAASNAATQVFQPVEKAIVQPASAALVNLDKSVGKAIPGGWGTVGMVAASMIPGMTPLAMGGLGALNGSGVLRPGGKFNLQGAMMGGAMSYGMASLGEYARGAVPSEMGNAPVDMSGATAPVSGGITSAPVDSIEALNQSQGWTGPNATNVGSNIPQNAITAANNASAIAADAASRINPATNLQYGSVIGDTLAGNAPVTPSIGSQIMSGNFGDALSQVGTNISEGATNAYNSAANFADKAITPSTYENALTGYGENVSKTGEGIQNLLGLGEVTGKEAATAAAKAAATAGTTSPMLAAAMTTYGGMGLVALEEQRKYLEEAKKANTISQSEYDSAMAEINRSTEDARRAVAEHPFSTNPDRSPTGGMETIYDENSNPNKTLYARSSANSRLYAVGGSVNPPDDQTGLPNKSPADGLTMGGITGMTIGGIPGYAQGGMPPRFLSGGGDGMSDSIPASIGGKQEARLADGEFVIPADVVSHLGNGSSKAGAKQLYSMMDKVRMARTGRKSQGKQINPRKYLAA